MRIAVLVNDLAELVPTHSTHLLIDAAVRRGHTVSVCAVASLSLGDGDRVEALGRTLTGTLPLSEAAAEPVRLGGCDVLLMRTNPVLDRGRAWAHDVALEMARIVQSRGVLVLNEPEGLARAGSKLYLGYLPVELRPRTLVSHDRNRLLSFVTELDGPCVLKPLRGARGWKVFLITPDESANVNQIVDVVLRDGFAMAQEFLPTALTDGDVRLLLLDGQLVEVDGHVAGIRRRPGSRDFRTNLTAGGKVGPVVVTDEMRRVAGIVGPRLAADGLFMAGLDLIGGKVVDVNAYTTGGLHDAQAASGVDFAARMIEAVEIRRATALA